MNHFKSQISNFIFAAVLALACILSCSLPPEAKAQGNCANSSAFFSGTDYRPDAFSGSGLTNCTSTGPNFQSNVVWFIAPICATAPPRLLSATFTGDVVNNHLLIYSSTNSTGTTNAGVSGTNQLWIGNGNSPIASNDVIVIHYVASGSYQRCVVTNATTSQIGIFPSTALATAANDEIWKMTQMGTLPSITVARTNYSATSGLFYGRKGAPFLVEMNYSNAATFQSIVGDFPRSQ